MNAALALLAAGLGGYSIPELIKWLIIVCAIVAVAWVAFRAMGVAPPGWAIQIFWIVVIAAVALIAISILMSL